MFWHNGWGINFVAYYQVDLHRLIQIDLSLMLNGTKFNIISIPAQGLNLGSHLLSPDGCHYLTHVYSPHQRIGSQPPKTLDRCPVQLKTCYGRFSIQPSSCEVFGCQFSVESLRWQGLRYISGLIFKLFRATEIG